MKRSDIDRITDGLVRQGKIIEAGWAGLRLISVAPDAPQIQIDEMRNSFFAGARHLFSSIMSALDPDEEPTDEDMLRMSKIQAELDDFILEFKLRHTPTRGQG